MPAHYRHDFFRFYVVTPTGGPAHRHAALEDGDITLRYYDGRFDACHRGHAADSPPSARASFATLIDAHATPRYCRAIGLPATSVYDSCQECSPDSITMSTPSLFFREMFDENSMRVIDQESGAFQRVRGTRTTHRSSDYTSSIAD